ncbi:hypothetical protein BpHYR1_006739 [Brachionus plicatilis]|uniref:Uncharacterized protein n=1 Tax=Brachionus plicatilis TaxID=10195 RepID=A0A3M7RLG5_BRAPC|nr:hypothetical protein BpHYR1_006739 [Brachionus plicatilis]
MTSFLKYKNLIDESINQLDQFEEAFKQLRQSDSPDEHEEETNNLLDSISSFILELLQESRLMSDEENANKCSLLKILAIKAICLIDWNLNELEKEIPFVELCDLMDYLVFLTNLHQNCSKSKTFKLKKLTNLDLIKLEKEQIFVLQFYLRWNLRLKLSSKNHYCAKVKNNKLGLTSTKETIDYLDFFFKYLNNNDLYRPGSSCFSIRNDQSKKDVYNFDLNWNNMIKYDKNEIRNIINYDLGMYFFQQEEYEEAFYYFHSVKDYKNKLINEDNNKVNELDSYANELESYLIACKSMLNIDIDDDSCTTTIISNSSNLNEDDLNTKQVITKMVLIENCIKNNLKNVFTKIPEESFLVLVQKMNHKNVDKDLKKKFQQFMELIMEAKEKEYDIENEEEEDHQFEEDDEDYDDEENEDNFDDDDQELYPDQEHFHGHETCCPGHSIKLPKEELRPIDFFHQLENFESNQVPKSAAQRKKDKRKLKKKLKKLQKEENMDRLSTTASTTSSNTTTTTSTVNVNEIINQKGKDLKLIRKKLNKEAKEQAEKELERQLQKIVTSSKKNSQSQNQSQKNQTKPSKKKKSNKKKSNKKNTNKPSRNEYKSESTVESSKEDLEQSEQKDQNVKTLGDLDDFSEPETFGKLNDLDDFEPVKVNSRAKLDSLDDFNMDRPKFDKLNVLDDFDDIPKKSRNFQRIVVPEDIFCRVVGTKNSNLTLIEKITSATLKLDKYTVEIVADTMECVEFALELLHTLINDPQASLTYLLPGEVAQKSESKATKNESKTKKIFKVAKQNPAPQVEPVVASRVENNVPAYKPRNFAEAVAKKPTSSQQVKTFSTQVANQKAKALPQPILASNNTYRPVSVVSPFKNDNIVEKLEELKLEANSGKQMNVPPSTPMYSSQSVGSFSSSASSSSSTKLEQKQQASVFDAISQLWSLSENDLLDRLSPFVSTSSANIDKIDTTDTCSNVAVSKPIGYERNGRLQQTNSSSSSTTEKQYALVNPIASQKQPNETIRKAMTIGYPTQVQTNQWYNYNAYYQQEAAIPFLNSNYVYHNYGYSNNFGLNGGYGIQMTQQSQPNMVLQSTVGNVFPQQQYRY